MSDTLKHLTDNDFGTSTANGVWLVDFWAEWCGPCRALAPIIEKLADTYKGKAMVGKLEVDDNPDTGQMFSIMSIPTVIIFKDGKEVKRLIGAQNADKYEQALNSALS